MIRTLAAALATSTCIVALAAPAAAQTRDYNIPAGSLKAALDAYVRQSGRQIVYRADEVRTARSPGVRGQQSADAALAALLAGSGFATRTDGNLIAIVKAGNGDSGSAAPPPAAAYAGRDDDAVDRAIVVTGSRIRGGRPSSPVVTISAEEMRLAGHNSLGEAMRALPQNFSGGQNPGVAPGATAGGPANQNVTGSSSLNLRGLGPDASLTLLNGTRLPYDGFTQAADLSVIPTAAIQRVEILLDGASAIYGSDAVGGVANVILRRDYEGAQATARYGWATDGGYQQQQYTVLGGHNWGSGGLLITGDYSHNSSVKASQRDYLSYLSSVPGYEIYPRNKQFSALFSGHQRLADFVELSVDSYYTSRINAFLTGSSSTVATYFESKSEVWGVAPALSFDIGQDWNLRLSGSMSRNVSSTPARRTFNILTGVTTSRTNLRNTNHSESVALETEGRLFSLPGGDVRVSLGGGWRRSFFENRDLITGAGTATPNGGGDDSSYYGYGEVNIPVVSEEQGIPLVRRFAINAAVRHENYDSFGGTTTPKVGALWGVAKGLDLRASWGRSFKVPTLLQQYTSRILYLTSAAYLGGAQAGAPADGQGILLFGGNQDLRPERAETLSAGFTFKPEFVPGLELEANWFQVDYRDRIIAPITVFNQALTNPAYAEFAQFSPSAADINAAFAWAGLPQGTFTYNLLGSAYNSSKVFAIVSGQYTNAARDLLRGIDLSARYATRAVGGRLALSANGSWITTAARHASSTSPETAIAGSIFYPAKFRGRLGANWSSGGFSLASNVNHISGVIDTNVTPNVRRGSMTTADFVVDYRQAQSPIGAFRLNLSVMNAFNAAPPYAAPIGNFRVAYDSTNYSSLGRTVSLALTKEF
ncbi:TonB-dependent receptor [Sphingomonas sp. HITSZ_GF]|uniref:TonB-dependent receptor plug domain-containing protein n=1 Tax=Sphingomonas sp. HITSZ_GF TaxID=3037247 RepID=UPI00240DC570|nr:TonB-dependent receptor [Sphingomonas sp. HITSZ_GF]MDG2535903.1 TonB-dependent receptor [Sphingomonas sp. HITSZ_GF]